MDVSRPSTRHIVAVRLTTRLTSKVVASGLGCDDNTIAGRGVDVAILGVDIAILVVGIAILGADIANLSIDIAILRRKQKGWGLQEEEGEGY